MYHRSDRQFAALRPTFVFLQGSKQIHTIRGADRTYVLIRSSSLQTLKFRFSGLQNAVKRFAGSSSGTGAFAGQGHTLGGTPPPVTHDLTASVSSIWSNMDPPLKVLLGLLAVYVFFWLM